MYGMWMKKKSEMFNNKFMKVFLYREKKNNVLDSEKGKLRPLMWLINYLYSNLLKLIIY